MAQQTQDFFKRDVSVSMGEANLYTIAFTLPAIFLLIAIFSIFWGFESLGNSVLLQLNQASLFLLAVIAGIFLHEYLHKIGWWLAARIPYRSIRFGFQWRTFTPYTHCTEPLHADAYRIGTVLPGLSLGILPAIYALVTGNGIIFIWGIIFIFAAGGDLLILWLLRFTPKDTLVEDHPERAGCYILEKQMENRHDKQGER